MPRVKRSTGLLPDVLATVIPRPRSAYNNFALPIKLFDYLSYGRPLLVTACDEQARVVRDADAGIVSADDAGSLADSLTELSAAGSPVLDRWSDNARRAAIASSWGHRAADIVAVLENLRG